MPTHDPKSIEEKRRANLESGRLILQQTGINPDDYTGYFRLMASNDVPVINNLPTLSFIMDMDDLKRAEGGWLYLKGMYDAINVNEQDATSGRDIIISMKAAMGKFDELFSGYIRECRTANEILQPSLSISDARKSIVELAHKYTDEVPAYRAYRHYGRFLLDPEGLRGYQQRKAAVTHEPR